MKKTISLMLMGAVLNFWIPCVNAEISKDLDPMMPPEPPAIVTGESSVDSLGAGQASGALETPEVSASDKQGEKTKKGKSKKSSKKKSSEKKKTKSSSKSSKKHKKSSPQKGSF